MSPSEFLRYDFGKGNRCISNIYTSDDSIKQIRRKLKAESHRLTYRFMSALRTDNSLLCKLGKIGWSDGSTTLINVMDVLDEKWRIEFVEQEVFRNKAKELINAGEAIEVVDVKDFEDI